MKNKNPSFKIFSYFGKWNLLAPNLKDFLHFTRDLKKAKNKKIHIFCFFRDNKRKKVLLYFLSLKKGKFSKLKYFLIIIIKCFFSCYNIFPLLNKLFFRLLRGFRNFHDHIVAFFLFLL